MQGFTVPIPGGHVAGLRLRRVQADLLVAGGEHLLGGETPGGGRRAGVIERDLRRVRSAVSGVRSSWEALATKCR